mgnify:CR=1 FL=1
MAVKKANKKTNKKATKKTTSKATKQKQTDKKIKKTKKSTKAMQPSSQLKELVKKLNNISKTLNEEGLLFLIKQAQVLQHNLEVEKNFTEQKLQLQKNIDEGAVEKKAKINQKPLTITESDDSSYFIIEMNTYRSFFTLDEMRKLVKMSHESKNETEATRKMYTWLNRERSDVVRNAGLNSKKDLVLLELYAALIKSYCVKE